MKRELTPYQQRLIKNTIENLTYLRHYVFDHSDDQVGNSVLILATSTLDLKTKE